MEKYERSLNGELVPNIEKIMPFNHSNGFQTGLKDVK